MIDPTEIRSHLRTFLPAFTDLFSNKITGATATTSGTTVTVTATAHGLSVGNKIVVGGGTFENGIASVVDNGDGTVRFETDDDHDVTEAKERNDPKTITLDGIGSPWDGEQTIVSIPNRKHFEIKFPLGETVPPDISTAVLVEDRSGFVGVHVIATVPTVDTFTFEITAFPSMPTGTVVGLEIITGTRIYGAANIERAQELYTKRVPDDEAALFIIMMDVDVSKDRHSLNDSTATFTKANTQKQFLLQNFATVVFLPTEDTTSGFKQSARCYDEIYRALVSVMFGFFFTDPDTSTKYLTVNNGHGPGVYNTAYYTHVYEWQTPSVITSDNGFLLEPSVAFRDILSTWDNDSDPLTPMTLNIDLDDEPL